MTNPKRPRDPNELARLIADIAVGDKADENPDTGKDPAAVALGRKGGIHGGRARAESLSSERKSEIAAKAAKARWQGVEEK
ncbi:histone H1 [Tsuneonella rigui]|uniref:histone H1 n=1 Tax=Tsuneonella rigui TaxID=1708790 RepID=UPI000F7E8999|nr:histone H1 [Tsuneonella rigui]